MSISIDNNLIEIIKIILPYGSTILELGSGEGTKELSQYYKMISIEENKEYLDLYDSKYIYAPISPIKPTKRFPTFSKWYSPEILRKELPKLTYDLILVDGPYIERGGFWKYHNLFNLNLPIIFDDSQWNSVAYLTYLIANVINEPITFHINTNKDKSFSVILPRDYKVKIPLILNFLNNI